VGGGPECSARFVTGESLASLLRLIVHFADLALLAKTPTHHGVHRTDTNCVRFLDGIIDPLKARPIAS
jgi:hypothetical protein